MAVPTRRGPGRPRHPIERGALITIAAKRFAELGYAAASLGEIAEAAGLRKASLYYHFATKESLYAEVLDTMIMQLRSLLVAARLDLGDFVERLDRLGALVTDYFAEHPHAAVLLSREMFGDSDYLRAGGREAIQTNLQATAAFLEAGMAAGAFRRQNPQHLALSIVGLHVFYFASAATTSQFLGRGVFSPELVRQRKACVLEQVRALCLGGNTRAAGASSARPRRPRGQR